MTSTAVSTSARWVSMGHPTEAFETTSFLAHDANRSPETEGGTLGEHVVRPNSLPWARKTLGAIRAAPFKWFVLTVAGIYFMIFIQQVILGADVRLMVYLLESVLVFFLPITFAERREIRTLSSATDAFDILIGTIAIGFLVGVNLLPHEMTGVRPHFGFVDASLFLLAVLLLYYGRKRLKQFIVPLLPFMTTILVILVVSNENQVFIKAVGKYFISFMVWSSGSTLQLMGYSVATGTGYFEIGTVQKLVVVIGFRCGGLDIALIYSMILAAFLWQPRAGRWLKVGLALSGAVGALALNMGRIVIITLVYFHEGPSIGEVVHQNLGDALFLAYITGFWWAARSLLGRR